MKRRAFLGLTGSLAGGLILGATAVLRPGAGWAQGAAARTAAENTTFLAALYESHISPRFAALADATADLNQRLAKFCTAPDAAGFAAARDGFHAAMDAWIGAQHLRPGPLLLNLRSDRFALWPERRNVVGRQLAGLLAAKDPAALEPKAFAKASAAIQGLPALERLLFEGDNVLGQFGADTEDARYRCAVAQAIGGNIADIAAEVRGEWAALAPVLARGEATSVGPTPAEAVTNLYSSLVTMVQVVADQKLLAPLGASIGEAKPGLAESARSGRSGRNIGLNLAAIRAMLLGENNGPGFVSLLPASPEAGAVRTAVIQVLDGAQLAAEALPGPIEQAVAVAQKRPAVETVQGKVKAVRDVLTGRLPPLIGVNLGFNELDGD